MGNPVSHTFLAFNTVNTVAVLPAEREDAEGLQTAFADVEAESARLERLFSHTMPGSELVRVNEARGQAVTVDPELASFLRTALRYCAETDGAFDITAGPLVALWDFKRAAVPPQAAVEDALRHVGYRRVHVEGDVVQLEDPSARLALGGIAKGYIADRLCDRIESAGFRHFCVNLGGNVAVRGGKPDGAPWNVGLRVPRSSSEAQESAFAAVRLASGSVVTSGVYERAFAAPDGTLCHHILDLRTGRPAKTDVASASVVSARSLDGDGYTTALVVMGLPRAMRFVEERPGLEAVFVTMDGHVHATSGIGSTIPFNLLA